MSDSDDTQVAEKIKVAAHSAATLRALAGDPRVSIAFDDWRPPGVIVNEPVRFLDAHEVTRQAIAALQSVSWIFQRNGSLVRPLFAANAPVSIEQIDDQQALMALCRNSAWWGYKYNTKTHQHDWHRLDPPAKYVKLVLGMKRYADVKTLRGVLSTPSVRADGSAITANGYDSESGWLLNSNVKPYPVPDRPTDRQVRAAVRLLTEPFAAHAGRDHFPFVSDVDRWVPIAAMLTILARPAIQGCVPMFAFDATTAGTGKGKLASVVSTVCFGKTATVQRFPFEEEELSKTLEAAADSGDNAIFFDNIKRQISGSTLEMCITTGHLNFRVLGKTERKSVDWNAVIFATGNNLRFGPDMSRRCYVARLRSPVERPDLLTNWKHKDLIGYVRGKRSSMIWAALTLLRGYMVSGQRSQCQLIGSFEEWIRVVPSAIKWATGIDLIDCLYKPDASDENNDIRILLLELMKLHDTIKSSQLSTREIIDHAYFSGFGPVAGQPLRDALEAIISQRSGKDASGRPSAKSVTNALNSIKGRIVDGLSLISGYDNQTNVWKWSIRAVDKSSDRKPRDPS